MNKNQISIRCADGTIVHMQGSSKLQICISAKNIIVGLMLGTTSLMLALIAYTH